MFATQCSKPDITNAMIGKKMARDFPAISFAVEAINTAAHTRMLHKIPEIRAGRKDRLTFPRATFIVNAPRAPLESVKYFV